MEVAQLAASGAQRGAGHGPGEWASGGAVVAGVDAASVAVVAHALVEQGAAAPARGAAERPCCWSPMQPGMLLMSAVSAAMDTRWASCAS